MIQIQIEKVMIQIQIEKSNDTDSIFLKVIQIQIGKCHETDSNWKMS